MHCIRTTLCSGGRFSNCLLSRSLSSSSTYDIAIVGGGVVGCATARQLKLDHPKLDICIVEKEYDFAYHQSGNNSGVLHAGIYYTPGSLKAQLCVRGHKLLLEYCKANNIAHKLCGKLIVATGSHQVEEIDKLYVKGQGNGAELSLVDSKGIQEIEPKARGVKAIWSPKTGIVRFRDVTKQYVKDFESSGGQTFCGFKVAAINIANDKIELQSDSQEKIYCRRLISCAGLYSDRISVMTGGSPTPKIVPFRGEYLLLKQHKSDLVSTNIYPVANPKLPFLGVHFTPRMDGRVILGPNAVLAFSREGYNCTDVNVVDLIESLNYPGLQKLVSKHFMAGVNELYKGFILSAQVEELKKFVPELEIDDVERGPSGVRAQALELDGDFCDDFIFDTGEGDFKNRALHVRNAPSPAATSSMAIAEVIATRAKELFSL